MTGGLFTGGLFTLKAPFGPKGDQASAISALVEGLKRGEERQTLLGVTGSGKTFTMASVAAEQNLPVLVLSPNKTLAAQLYSEFKGFFPENAVEYFVSYYDYYQPEAYVPRTDTYIEKDAAINDRIDRLRLSTTSSLLSRRDVIVVASVSCIYGLGAPEEYMGMVMDLERGRAAERDEAAVNLVMMQYLRGEDLSRGTFRIRGNILDIHPAYMEEAYRIEFGDEAVERISVIDPLTASRLRELDSARIYPAKHFVTSRPRLEEAIAVIEAELAERLVFLREEGRLLEAQRLEMRTNYDIEMIREIGYCSGIENYSRHIAGREEGEPPFTLLDYFGGEFLTFIDESHVAVPQIRAMFKGDRARKETLVEHGFRLPSARDNRPLTFEEFTDKVGKVIFVSATPGAYEREVSTVIAEQIVRPTGLVDPVVTVKPAEGQVDDLMDEAARCIGEGGRALVTTLTKKTAEDLTAYLEESGFSVGYLHSEIDTLDRIEILRSLRKGEIDILVGINLLREGLDLPEVSLVAILDGDREGFLRSETSLVQTFGRAARHEAGRVIIYADRITGAISAAIEETTRRRRTQEEFNERHGITPAGIEKVIDETPIIPADPAMEEIIRDGITEYAGGGARRLILDDLEREMRDAAERLDFERAAAIRDRIESLAGERIRKGRGKGRKAKRGGPGDGKGRKAKERRPARRRN